MTTTITAEPTTEPATAPHSTTLEALSRLTLLLREHRNEIPPDALVFFVPTGRREIAVQVSAYASGTTIEQRRALVDLIARICGTPVPEESTHEDRVFYGSSSPGWRIYTADKRSEDGAA